jgi:hypothetical protein
MPEPRSGNWTIELRVYPIPKIGYFGGHMFWVLKDPEGNVREELHFSGQPGTELEFIHRKEADIGRDNKYMEGSIREPLLQYSAPHEEILRRWRAGRNTGELFHARPHFDYPSEWDTVRAAAGDGSIANSNAGAYTIGKSMLPELVRKEKSTTIPTPGWGVDLFEYDYPGIPPQSPDDTRPNMDVRPDFRNETRNERRTRYTGFSGTVRSPVTKISSGDIAGMTPSAALRAIETAKADDAFGKRYVKGDRDAVDYLHALHLAAYPEPEAVVGPKVRPDLADATPGDPMTRDRGMTPARRALEAAKADKGFVTRYLDGDRDAFAHMQSLILVAYPEPEALDSDRA